MGSQTIAKTEVIDKNPLDSSIQEQATALKRMAYYLATMP
jgi:hypothetical protein